MELIYKNNENYDIWLSRIRNYELKIAEAKLLKGIPIDVVLEEMSKRIIKKMLHPILTELNNIPDNYNIEESRKAYNTAMKYPRPAADHVLDD